MFWISHAPGRWAGWPRFPANPDASLQELAGLLAGPHSAAEARAAIVYLAWRLTGALGVELELPDGPGRPPRVVARWPLSAGANDELRELVVPLRLDGRLKGNLRLSLSHRGQAWPERVLRRLAPFAVLAAAAELRFPHEEADDPVRDPITGAHHSGVPERVFDARRRPGSATRRAFDAALHRAGRPGQTGTTGPTARWPMGRSDAPRRR